VRDLRLRSLASLPWRQRTHPSGFDHQVISQRSPCAIVFPILAHDRRRTELR
jgi:hypothetical protein